MMISFNDIKKENTNVHSPERPQIPNHPYQILIISGLGLRKTNVLAKLEILKFKKEIIKQTPNSSTTRI